MKAHVNVFYPAEGCRLVMRTEADWGSDIEPVAVSPDGTRHEFVIESDREFLECKAGLYRGDELHLSVGANYFIPTGSGIAFEGYPHFFSGERGQISQLIEIDCKEVPPRKLRIYLPSGYEENVLAHYPVIYMHDGANLFLPEEAFQGQEWEVDETMDLMDRMHLIRRSIVVGIHAQERVDEYTQVGYQDYGRALKDEIKPWVDEHLRTLPGPQDTFVLGSSLGGVVSFFLGWEWPEVFGNVACLSSTFTYRDDLVARVRDDDLGPRRDLRIYLDSGWPGDNYEATLTMAIALVGRGFLFGRDFLHFAFPLDEHSERHWGGRLHLPIQFFAGHPRRLSVAMREARKTSPVGG